MITGRTRWIVAIAAVLVVIAAALATAVAVRDDEERETPRVTSSFDRFPASNAGHGPGRTVPGAPDARQRLVAFVGFVFRDVQQFWRRQFARAGVRYTPATLVLFRRRTRSGCGVASTATGPFYCPVDQRVYLDLGFFRELALRFDAPGDFAQAYVIAHEVGHHVQTLVGLTQEVQSLQAQAPPPVAQDLSIRTELQADCLAGVWAHSTYERRLLDEGDLDEAINAAAAVGDDRIQARTIGRIVPETWTHGSSEQRVSWLLRGFESGEPAACQTFEV